MKWYKSLWIIFVIILIILFPFSIPIINNNIAYKTASHLKEIALPDKTEYVEMFSAAGNLVGNSNGMQYLGGILIKSDLPLAALRSYYSQYANNEWECIVDSQRERIISLVEHSEFFLKTDVVEGNYYIVYSWGQSDFALSALDLRAY